MNILALLQSVQPDVSKTDLQRMNRIAQAIMSYYRYGATQLRSIQFHQKYELKTLNKRFQKRSFNRFIYHLLLQHIFQKIDNLLDSIMQG